MNKRAGAAHDSRNSLKRARRGIDWLVRKIPRVQGASRSITEFLPLNSGSPFAPLTSELRVSFAAFANNIYVTNMWIRSSVSRRKAIVEMHRNWARNSWVTVLKDVFKSKSSNLLIVILLAQYTPVYLPRISNLNFRTVTRFKLIYDRLNKNKQYRHGKKVLHLRQCPIYVRSLIG